jgi:ferredoxin
VATVTADLGACQGYAGCVRAADDYFDIVDDGVIVLPNTDVPTHERARAEKAARTCPVLRCEWRRDDRIDGNRRGASSVEQPPAYRGCPLTAR